MKRFLVVLLALIFLSTNAFADESMLSVIGSGTVSLTADIASVSLGVNMEGKDLTSLQQNVNERVQAICKALKQAGLPEESITTSRINISPVYDYNTSSISSMESSDGSRIFGYSIDNTLSITTEDIDKIGAYIDAAFEAGANSFDYISFGIKDDSEAAMKALELAVQDARAKAEVIAAASGKGLGEIVQICEGSSSNYSSNAIAKDYIFAMEEHAAAGTTVRASQVEISAQVEITYELK